MSLRQQPKTLCLIPHSFDYFDPRLVAKGEFSSPLSIVSNGSARVFFSGKEDSFDTSIDCSPLREPLPCSIVLKEKADSIEIKFGNGFEWMDATKSEIVIVSALAGEFLRDNPDKFTNFKYVFGPNSDSMAVRMNSQGVKNTQTGIIAGTYGLFVYRSPQNFEEEYKNGVFSFV